METLREMQVLEIIQKQRLEEARREAELAAQLRELNPGRSNRRVALLGILLVLVPLAIWVAASAAG